MLLGGKTRANVHANGRDERENVMSEQCLRILIIGLAFAVAMPIVAANPMNAASPFCNRTRQLFGRKPAVAGNIVAVIAGGLHAYAFTTAIAVISTMISGMAKAATVSNVLAGKSLP